MGKLLRVIQLGERAKTKNYLGAEKSLQPQGGNFF